MFPHAAVKCQEIVRQEHESKTGCHDPSFKSVLLPPDMDSNQTLTASCRADVWAAATFKPQDTEKGIDGREITVN